jgi:ribonuclease D
MGSLIDHLSSEPVVAMDTESNSLFAYQEQVCLIQISVPGTDYLVDVLSGLDVSPLGVVLADPGIEKVFHAAEYDVMCLRRDYGWSFCNLFDTMWAARVLGWPRVGLANILKEQFGVRLNKRWQRYNWGRRPLPDKALAYARLDTHYLIPLRNRLVAELQERNRVEEAREFFREVAQAEPNFTPFNPETDLWRVKGVWDLTARERAVLRQLIIWRDREAERRDRPHFKILHDRILTEIAQMQPERAPQLKQIKGLKQHHVRRYGRKIIRAIERGRQDELPQPPPRSPRPPDKELERYEALRDWRKRVARQRGVDPDVVVSNAVLKTLAHHAPRSLDQLDRLDVLGPWKQKTHGQSMLDVIQQHL